MWGHTHSCVCGTQVKVDSAYHSFFAAYTVESDPTKKLFLGDMIRTAFSPQTLEAQRTLYTSREPIVACYSDGQQMIINLFCNGGCFQHGGGEGAYNVVKPYYLSARFLRSLMPLVASLNAALLSLVNIQRDAFPLLEARPLSPKLVRRSRHLAGAAVTDATPLLQETSADAAVVPMQAAHSGNFAMSTTQERQFLERVRSINIKAALTKRHEIPNWTSVLTVLIIVALIAMVILQRFLNIFGSTASACPPLPPPPPTPAPPQYFNTTLPSGMNSTYLGSMQNECDPLALANYLDPMVNAWDFPGMSVSDLIQLIVANLPAALRTQWFTTWDQVRACAWGPELASLMNMVTPDASTLTRIITLLRGLPR